MLREHPTLVALDHHSAMGSTEHEGQELTVLALDARRERGAHRAWPDVPIPTLAGP
jgi:hypothetical protein